MNIPNIFKSPGSNFYLWFEEAAANNVKAAKKLEILCKNFKDPQKVAKDIQNLEHIGDSICHNIYRELNKIFVAPMDREDITNLTQSLDDVMDLIHESADNMAVYNVKKSTKIAVALSETIVKSTKIVAEALPNLRKRNKFKDVQKSIIEINRLENEADELLRNGLKDLFKNPKNAIDIIRWHDIYKSMEAVTDSTEDTANILNDLVTKYG